MLQKHLETKSRLVVAIASVLVLLLLFPSVASPQVSYTSTVYISIFNILSDAYFFVKNNISNVDSSQDIGTHTNFTAQQYGPDVFYDTLIETTSGIGAGSELLECLGFSNDKSNWDNFIGTTPYLRYADYPANYIHEVKTGSVEAGWFTFDTTTLSGTITVNVTLLCRTDDLDDYIGVYVDYTGSGAGNRVGAIGGHTDWQNETISLGPLSVTEVNNLRVFFDTENSGGGDDYYIDYMVIGTNSFGLENYNLDLEVQWTDVDYDQTNEELAIFAYEGTNTHSLDATGGHMLIGDGTPDWGSTTGTISFWVKWDAFGAGSASPRLWGQHEDFKIRQISYMDIEEGLMNHLLVDWGSTITIVSNTNFILDKWYFIAVVWNEDTDNLYLYVGDENNAPVEDTHISTWTSTVSTVGATENNFMNSRGSSYPTDGCGDDLRYWSIDRTLGEIQSDYNTELTGSETNLLSYFKLNNNFDDLGPNNSDGSGSGSYSFFSDVSFEEPSSENIRVDVWTGTSWQNVIVSLTNGWNNVTVTTHLTSSTFTIRFKGSTEIDDSIQDSLQIDATLIHVWS